MGLLILENFRAELRLILDRNISDTQADIAINFGYFDLCSAVDFEKLDEVFPVSTVAGQREYPYTPIDSADHLMLKLVYNTTQGRLLDPVPKQQFYSYEPYLASPNKWALDRNLFLLHPTPSAGGDSLRLVYKKQPVALVAGQATVIPKLWDLVIVMLAAKHSFMVADEHDKAAVWGQNALNYIQTRITEDRGEEKLMEGYPPLSAPATEGGG